jgi:hypothetical protein
MAHNFETKLNTRKSGPGPMARGGLSENTNSAAERRGLLDDDDMEQIEFEIQKKDA